MTFPAGKSPTNAKTAALIMLRLRIMVIGLDCYFGRSLSLRLSSIVKRPAVRNNQLLTAEVVASRSTEISGTNEAGHRTCSKLMLLIISPLKPRTMQHMAFPPTPISQSHNSNTICRHKSR